MLKIRARKFNASCAKHKRYEPATDGQGAIRGACQRCQLLFDIHQAHLKLNSLMREFTPAYSDVKRPKRLPKPDPRQMPLLQP